MLSHIDARQIEWGDCDPAGIVFHPRYLSYFDNCTNLLFAKAGFDLATLQARFAVIGYPVVNVNSRFVRPCLYGDKVQIETCVTEFRNSSFDVQHKLYREGTLSVEAIITRVWAAKNPVDPQRMHGLPIPEAIKNAFKAI